ncbi:MAG: exodeoxyribonuclease III [Rhodothalassiaceae bacterium]
MAHWDHRQQLQYFLTRNTAADFPVRLLSWNCNSIRARLTHALRLIEQYQPDIVCLQETKVANSQFPVNPFKDRGYRHIALNGQRMHHGVAILSRWPFRDPVALDWCGKSDCRHQRICLTSGVEVHNFYVPSGGDTPDPEANPRFAHKLAFLDEMIAWAPDQPRPMILVGDLNVAPLETDVWSHKQMLGVVSHTPPETARLTQLLSAGRDWVDGQRHIVPTEQTLFTWWSYRARDWRASNRGRRLDHLWLSRPLLPHYRTMQILDQARDWEKPSDHAPVLAEFDDGVAG